MESRLIFIVNMKIILLLSLARETEFSLDALEYMVYAVLSILMSLLSSKKVGRSDDEGEKLKCESSMSCLLWKSG